MLSFLVTSRFLHSYCVKVFPHLPRFATVSDPSPAQADGALGEHGWCQGAGAAPRGLCRPAPAARCAEGAFHGSVPSDAGFSPVRVQLNKNPEIHMSSSQATSLCIIYQKNSI